MNCRVCVVKTIALSDQAGNAAAPGEIARPFQSVSRARAAVHAVKARLTLTLEQIAVGEFKVAAVLVGDRLRVARERRGHDHGDRFDDLREIRRRPFQRPFPFQGHFRQGASHRPGKRLAV